MNICCLVASAVCSVYKVQAAASSSHPAVICVCCCHRKVLLERTAASNAMFTDVILCALQWQGVLPADKRLAATRDGMESQLNHIWTPSFDSVDVGSSQRPAQSRQGLLDYGVADTAMQRCHSHSQVAHLFGRGRIT